MTPQQSDIQLSRNFWLREFLRSETAARMGREIEPTSAEIANLNLLCENILQPIRDALGHTITITSGLRPKWLNTVIGGAPYSEHIDGRAADFIIAGYTPYAATVAVSGLHLPWNQLIHEFGRWTHVSVAPPGISPNREIKTARFVAGHVEYPKGVLQV